ncbi:MAG: TatD DNase family protein [Sphingobacteriales bacterium]|jgi:TatD DNase family protein
MQIIDTHTHIYLPEFKEDIAEVIHRAKQVGVSHFCLPNIDEESIAPIVQLCTQFPGIMSPMWGIHPCSVKADWKLLWEKLQKTIVDHPPIAIGEIGMDLYWDQSFQKEQEEALICQCNFAIQHNLPVAIHVRNAFPELFDVFDKHLDTTKLRGVFHCFSGDEAILEKALSYPHFLLGIGGVVTFKNGGLNTLIPKIPMQRIILETDAPYLAPKPFRGKRNEPSYLSYILEEIAVHSGKSTEEIAQQSTLNAQQLFGI